MSHSETSKSTSARPPVSQASVVFLVNFLSPNLLEVMREVSQRVGKLEIVVSVKMEANRQFEVDYKGLNVTCQRTWTQRKTVNHPGGYSEELFVHVPLDTWSQLRRIRPDCIVSLEMGMRSLQSALYRRFNRRARHVLSVYGSERSEAGRGSLRKWLRRRLLRAADIVTYNGPSCWRYLVSQGANSEQMMPWNYAADPQKIYDEAIIDCPAPAHNSTINLLTVSQLIERKGVDRALTQIAQWAQAHPQFRLHWAIAGTGPQADQLKQLPLPDNLTIDWLGHCDQARLKQLYANYPINFFPTLGDEWGLIVDEGLASGQVMLGSVHAQACETLVEPGRNGWQYNPDQPESLMKALDHITRLDDETLQQMRLAARQSVQRRTAVDSALQLVSAVDAALSR